MTEKEKMLKSELYQGFDTQLVQERQQAKEMTFEYNNLNPKQVDKREEILKQLLGKIGNNSWIEQPFYCDYGYNIEVGENFYSNHHCVMLDGAKIQIGNNVMLGPNVNIFTAGHPIDVKQRRAGLEYAKPITIGNDIWIGGNVVINPGITIGSDTIIGSGSVVTKDIPSNVIAVGNPCKVIKEVK